MKTMLDLLIRLVELRQCCERARDNPQLTDGEKAAARCLKELVRDCLPAEVLFYYDRLKESEPELLECPEVFAMAALVSTYRSLPPGGRKKLVNHFATPPSAGCCCNGHAPARSTQPRTGRVRVKRRQLVARN